MKKQHQEFIDNENTLRPIMIGSDLDTLIDFLWCNLLYERNKKILTNILSFLNKTQNSSILAECN